MCYKSCANIQVDDIMNCSILQEESTFVQKSVMSLLSWQIVGSLYPTPAQAHPAHTCKLPYQDAAGAFQSAPSTSYRCQPAQRNTRLRAATLEHTKAEIMKTVDVPLADRSYPINIGSGILDDGIMIQRHIPGNNVLIVTNETIAPLYLDR